MRGIKTAFIRKHPNLSAADLVALPGAQRRGITAQAVYATRAHDRKIVPTETVPQSNEKRIPRHRKTRKPVESHSKQALIRDMLTVLQDAERRLILELGAE
jgi:hypothetical protein